MLMLMLMLRALLLHLLPKERLWCRWSRAAAQKALLRKALCELARQDEQDKQATNHLRRHAPMTF